MRGCQKHLETTQREERNVVQTVARVGGRSHRSHPHAQPGACVITELPRQASLRCRRWTTREGVSGRVFCRPQTPETVKTHIFPAASTWRACPALAELPPLPVAPPPPPHLTKRRRSQDESCTGYWRTRSWPRRRCWCWRTRSTWSRT